MIDIAQVRRDTPGCETFIHFDNAGASPMPDPVFRAVTDHMAAERALGGYEAERRAQPALECLYTGLADLLNAAPDEIAYAENATRAWNMAVYALPWAEGDRVIVHGSEYASNMLAFLHLERRHGITIDIAPSDGTGQIDVDALERMITAKTKLISLVHVPTQGGLVNPAAAVGDAARRHGVTYALDACQSVGQMAVDVGKIGCDILTCTGRKYLRGPRGTGFLYIRRDLANRLDPPFIDLHAANWSAERSFDIAPAARRFENYESNVAGRIGLARAVAYARKVGIASIEARIESLAQELRQTLNAIRGVTLQDLGARTCGIVTFTIDQVDPIAVRDVLFQKGISTSVSLVNHARLDLGRRETGPVLRASVHYFNTEGEIERFGAAVARIALNTSIQTEKLSS
ncbi:aromatic amino acid beta-eliminating lyase/threonine aldolase [Rhodobacterales bacterium Y4I]|nr:aromatic amino acid beta-eliminating lyase/threonine aldolase [Rhodobacterales bacterium Y4I]